MDDLAPVRPIDSGSLESPLIKPTIHPRERDYLMVDPHEIRDFIHGTDSGTLFGGIGVFVLSGALWAGIAEAARLDVATWTPLLVFYSMCIVLGLTFLGFGIRERRRNTRGLRRVMSESKSLPK